MISYVINKKQKAYQTRPDQTRPDQTRSDQQFWLGLFISFVMKSNVLHTKIEKHVKNITVDKKNIEKLV